MLMVLVMRERRGGSTDDAVSRLFAERAIEFRNAEKRAFLRRNVQHALVVSFLKTVQLQSIVLHIMH